jgi:alkyl sulfatase BDS1-like metallo-beta-lactamase superfamily hydrolase
MTYALFVEDALLNYSDRPADKPDTGITLSKATLDSIQLKREQAATSGALRIEGRGLIETFPFWFNIVTP